MEPDFVIKKKVRFGSKDDYVADEADQVGKVDDLSGVMEVDIDSSCMQDVDRIESSLKEGVVYEQEENPVNEKGFNKEFGDEIEMDESEKSGSDDKNLVMPELLDDSSDSEDESWDSKARYGLVRGRNHPDQISLRVEYDRNEEVPVRKKEVVSVQSDHAVSNILLNEMNTRNVRHQHEHEKDNFSRKRELGTIREGDESDAIDSDSSIADGRQLGILGSRRTGKIVTVAISTPIESKSITSVPLIHAVVIYPIGKEEARRTRNNILRKRREGKLGLKVNSLQYNQYDEEMNQLREAFPEPNPAVFDNSIYVDVAMQAMSAGELNEDYLSMTSKTYEEMRRSYQIDGGASLTAISESKAMELKCRLIKRREFQIMVAVANGDKMRSLYYTPLKLTFKGTDDSGKSVMKTVMVIANVVPNLSGEIIIGSDVMKALRITIPYNDENTATLRVQGERLTFKYNTTEQLKKPVIKKLYVVTKSERSPMNATESFNALFYGDRYHDGKGRPLPEGRVRPIPGMMMNDVMREYNLAATDPKKYLQNFKTKEMASVAQIVGLHRVFSEYDVEIREGRQLLRRDGTIAQAGIKVMKANNDPAPIGLTMKEETATVIGRDLQALLSPSMPDHVRNEIIKKYMEYKITQVEDYGFPPDGEEDETISLKKMSVVDGEVIEDVEKETDKIEVEKQELEQTMKYLEEMRKSYCTNMMSELRPDEFPEELWTYVFDSQKIVVSDRWKRFKEKCNPPERLQEVIQQIMKIDISVENSSRKAEEPYFRAQCMANLHVYAHPDPRDPPSVKGREYEINLSDTSPCTAAMRRTSLLEKAYLYWRTKQLESRKMIGISSSAYNNPPLCVPYPAAIAAFIKKHGDAASEAIWKEENANEIVKLYRLVNDFRDLNNKTKLERWPLPYILDLIDKMRGSGRYSTEDIEDAFFTVPMKKEHRQFTAFSTPHGHFEYLCMGQGLKNAANFFARIVHEMFYGLQIEGRSMSVYQDDVCNYSNDLVEHCRKYTILWRLIR